MLLRREDEGIKKYVSLRALRILDRMDVETALEIHRKEVQDSIPDEKVSTTLALEEEWAISFKLPGRIDILPKRSRLFITNQLFHAVFIIDVHYPANITLIAGGSEPGHTNGRGSKARFKKMFMYVNYAED